MNPLLRNPFELTNPLLRIQIISLVMFLAGRKLDEDCMARIKIRGRLLPGQVCITRAGKLACKKVIHAVGPRWNRLNAGEENVLAMLVDSSLRAAEDEGLESIALPSVSTGIFGFPVDRAADVIMDAVRRYFYTNTSTTVRDVFLIDNDLGAVSSLERKLRTLQIEILSQSPEARGAGDNVIGRSQEHRPQYNQVPPPYNSQGGIYSGIVHYYVSSLL